MSAITIILTIIIILLLIVIYHFFTHYVDPLEYQMILYKNLIPQTGDILLVRELNSTHTFLSGNKLSHCGIIIIKDDTPFVLELSYPCVYLTKLEDRIKGGDGEMFYIRQLRRPLTAGELKKIPEIVEKSKNIKYTSRLSHYYIMCKYKTIEQLNQHTENENEAICSTYVIWMLSMLGLTDKNEVPGLNSVTYLTEFDHSHDKPKRIKFFPGKPFMRISDYAKLSWESLKNIGSKPETSTIMLSAVTIT